MPELATATIGWSTRTEAAEAGREAASAALSRLPLRQPQLALIFASSWLAPEELLAGVRSVLGSEVPLAGESTAGEIIPEGPITHSCVVLLLAVEGLRCRVGLGRDVDVDPRRAGQQAAYAALHGFDGQERAGCLLFGDGLMTTYAKVVRGIQEVLGTSALITGGLAGDDLRFQQTYQYANEVVATRAVVGAVISRPLRIGVGIEHGFAPISKPRRITRAHANRLLELDGRPAASVYAEYLGTEALHRMQEEGLTRQGIAYPFGIQTEAPGEWLLRTVVACEEGGGLACNSEIPEGGWLQLMIGSRELALDAAHRAAQQAVRSLGRVVCVLVFDSVVRRKLLGAEHAALEIARIRDAVGPAVPLVGCYTYGEQAPAHGMLTAGAAATQTGSVLVVALGM